MRPDALTPLFASAQSINGVGPRVLTFLKKALRLPPGVSLVSVDLTVQLEQLAFLVQLGRGE